MSENVHYHSWPIDRDFTFKEWCDYLHDRDQRGESASEVVAEFGGWKFNVHGVCLNRRCVLQKFIGRTGGQFAVKVYQAPKGHILGAPLAWYFDAYYSDGTSGGSAGWGEVGGNEDDAVAAGLEKVIEKFERSIKWYQSGGKDEERYPGRVQICKAGIKLARDEIVNRSQLTLF